MTDQASPIPASASVATLVAATPVEKTLLWLVRDLVAQCCTDTRSSEPTSWDGPVPVFSQFIGKYAEAIACLAAYGLVTDLTDNGGRVVGGKLLSLVETAQVLQTGVFAPKPEEALQTMPEIGDFLG